MFLAQNRLSKRDHLPLKMILLGLCTLVMSACSKESPVQGPVYTEKPAVSEQKKHYVFAIHPLHNPQLLQQKFEPLMRYLGEKIPEAEFDLDASNNYAEYEQKLREGRPDFSLPNPYHATLATDWGYTVIARMTNDDVFRGIFIVRTESTIKEPRDLKGKTVAYPAPTALAAAMMPQLYLQNHGVDVESELDNQYVGTHNSSIMNAYLKQSAASATWPVAWNAFKKANPKEASELKVIWQTPKLIQNAVIAKKDLPQGIVDKVQYLLVSLQDNLEGQAVMESIDNTGFQASTDKDFDVVREFLKEYNLKVKKKAP